jgi:DNA-binding IscR family transcriptional regulator
VRGPRGGYELARERRRITLADIVRAASASAPAGDDLKDGEEGGEPSALVRDVVVPAIDQASEIFLEKLQEITVDDLCRDAQSRRVFGEAAATYDFNI